MNKLGRSLATSVINLLWSVTTKCIAPATGTLHSMQWSQILAQNCDFCLPHLHSTTPLWGFPSEYCDAVWYGKTRMVWLPDGEKIWRYVYSFWQNVWTWHPLIWPTTASSPLMPVLADSAQPTRRSALSVTRTTTSATNALQQPDHVCGTRYHLT